ncbi:MAG: hypothetical protein ABIR29_08400, partial [Chthoniobacterales bacterium]
MSFRKRFTVFLLVVLLAGGLDALFAPFVIAHGVRWWIGWAAQRQGLTAQIERIDAPFLRPVTIRNLAIGPGKKAGHEVSFRAAVMVIDLNLRGWIFRKDANL